MKPITITPRQAADLYNLNLGTLANLRTQKRGPQFFRVGRKIFYRPADIEDFLFSNPVITIDSHLGGNGRGHTDGQ